MEKIAVIGLGYVGLPLAVALSGVHKGIVAYDINSIRVKELREGFDRNGDVPGDILVQYNGLFTSEPDDLSDSTSYIIAVPTPIDGNCKPDLGPVIAACELVAGYLIENNLVVLESTVYPGVTEEICGPALAQASGLIAGEDFFLGYSPERINPGDKEHTFSNVTKVVAADDQTTVDRLVGIYGSAVKAGLHVAPNIKIAEAAKVLENTQRDLNVALMNELAVICDKLEIATSDVLAAARTKWNFMPFTPGLVGGHCIGVDPYYLTTRAQQLGYVPQVILAGRRINDSMGNYIANKLIGFLKNLGKDPSSSCVGILGLSFKEDVSDLRNSKVGDIIKVLQELDTQVLIHDPFANPVEVKEKYGLELSSLDDMRGLDGLLLAVPHTPYLDIPVVKLCNFLTDDGVLIDIKAVVIKDQVPHGITYWAL